MHIDPEIFSVSKIYLRKSIFRVSHIIKKERKEFHSPFSWISLPEWCCLLSPRDKPIHYPTLKWETEKEKYAAAISWRSSPRHFHIGNLFYRIDFPGRLVSSHSFFNLQPHRPRLAAFVKSKKRERERERLFSRPLACMPTTDPWSDCQINHVMHWRDPQFWQLSGR